MEALNIIKIGGNIIDSELQLASFLKSFASVKGKKILVHGGGKLATNLAEAMGIQQQMVEGRRVTDAETLKIVTMVYAGYINKNIVAVLQANECNAVGLSGADGRSITAHKRINKRIDYGFAGDVDSINAGFINLLLTQNITPVFSPITADTKGCLLNTNADTIAQQLATALCKYYEVSLIYCFEKNGVLQNDGDDNSVIENITPRYLAELKENKIISAGMVPKLDNAFEALEAGVQHIIIGHAANIKALINKKTGTAITHAGV